MRVMLVRHPAARDVALPDILFGIGVSLVETAKPSLHAIALIRTLRPQLVVMETDSCDRDAFSLLQWLSSHDEAPNTILVDGEEAGFGADSPFQRSDRPRFQLPRDRDRFIATVEQLQADFRAQSPRAAASLKFT